MSYSISISPLFLEIPRLMHLEATIQQLCLNSSHLLSQMLPNTLGFIVFLNVIQFLLHISILPSTEGAKAIATFTTQVQSLNTLWKLHQQVPSIKLFLLAVILSFILTSWNLTIFVVLILYLTDTFICCTTEKSYRLDLPFVFCLGESVTL